MNNLSIQFTSIGVTEKEAEHIDNVLYSLNITSYKKIVNLDLQNPYMIVLINNSQFPSYLAITSKMDQALSSTISNNH